MGEDRVVKPGSKDLEGRPRGEGGEGRADRGDRGDRGGVRVGVGKAGRARGDLRLCVRTTRRTTETGPESEPAGQRPVERTSEVGVEAPASGVAGTPPTVTRMSAKVTADGSGNPAPARVIDVPPAREPDDGETEEMEKSKVKGTRRRQRLPRLGRRSRPRPRWPPRVRQRCGR